MLKTQEIIDKLDLIDRETFAPMLMQVNIPDFYKCIAQFSGLPISQVCDDVIEQYLITWCRNKNKYFKMLGNKIKLDQRFVYNRPTTDLSDNIEELGRQYPAFYLWLREFRRQTKNKIEISRWDNLYSINKDLFPDFNIDGSTMTHFFKSKLNAPDELVTAIGRLFENDKVEATHTISIDPVDMMLASENPYDWNSCYRLELDRSDSHADGCLAAVLDKNSLITYVWNSEGKYDMYGQFKFKKIRYYRMRQWIAIADDWGAIHFNRIYPGKGDYDNELEKMFRDTVENIVANHAGVVNIWRQNEYMEIIKKPDDSYYWRESQYRYHCDREFYYGYGEYDSSNIYVNTEINGEKIDKIEREEYDKIKNNPAKNIRVYNEKIVCPCGCGNYLIGSDECDEDCDGEGYEYNGEGFVAENFYERERYWCDYKDDYCDCECGSDCCEGCCYWDDAHPVCDLDDEECELFKTGEADPDVYDGVAHSNECGCEGCPRWDKCHKDEKNDAED